MSHMFNGENTELRILDLNKAIFYINKSIDMLNKKKKYLNDKGELDLVKNDLIEYEKYLGFLLVKKGDRQGVFMLEKIGSNDPSFMGVPLGDIFSEGKIVHQDLVKAYMYYDLGGDASIDDKERLAEQMTPEQINEALERSWQWQDQHRSYRPGYRNRADFPIQSHIIYK